jgi:hypothetical protein
VSAQAAPHYSRDGSCRGQTLTTNAPSADAVDPTGDSAGTYGPTGTEPSNSGDAGSSPPTGAGEPPAAIKGLRLGAFTWIFAAVALLASVAASIVAGRPAIAIAAVSGGLMVALTFVIYRVLKRRDQALGETTARRRRRRRLVMVLAVTVLVLCFASANFYIFHAEDGPHPIFSAAPVQTVDYHAEGRLDGDTILLNERIVLDERSMSGIMRSSTASSNPTATAGPTISPLPYTTSPSAAPGPTAPGPTAPSGPTDAASPVITVEGWQADGFVDGYPAFARVRTVSSEDGSGLADTVRIPINLGKLTATGSSGVQRVGLTPRTGSTVSVIVPKGSVGSAVPELASTTESLSGDRTEIITFDVGQYVSSASFDLLPGLLRNPAGRAVYDASLWGFWQWAAGAAGAAVSGLAVDKVGQGLWSSARWLFRRRVKAGTPAST